MALLAAAVPLPGRAEIAPARSPMAEATAGQTDRIVVVTEEGRTLWIPRRFIWNRSVDDPRIKDPYVIIKAVFPGFRPACEPGKFCGPFEDKPTSGEGFVITISFERFTGTDQSRLSAFVDGFTPFKPAFPTPGLQAFTIGPPTVRGDDFVNRQELAMIFCQSWTSDQKPTPPDGSCLCRTRVGGVGVDFGFNERHIESGLDIFRGVRSLMESFLRS